MSNMLKSKRFSLSGENILQNIPPAPDNGEVLQASPAKEALHPLAGGQLLRVDASGERIELENQDGIVSLSIHLDGDYPIVHLEKANLTLHSPTSVSFNCESFSVNTSENIEMHAEQHLKISSAQELQISSSEDDVRVTGKVIWLN